MQEPVRVTVVADDPVLREGAVTALTRDADIAVVERQDRRDVDLILTDTVDDPALAAVRDRRAGPHRPEVVLLVADVTPAQAQAAFAAGAYGLLRRREAVDDRLPRTVLAAATGDCMLPPDVLDGLLDDAGEPAGAGVAAGLDDRERAVLDLVADGCETSEIAGTLAYSTRTVTSVVQSITQRFHLRNRAHAVAYVLRAGLL